MKNTVIYLGKLAIFWLVFIVVQRIIFLLFNSSLLVNVSFGQVLLSYWHGLSMDISTIAYLLAIPSLLIIFALFTGYYKSIIRLVNGYNYCVVILYLIVSMGDIGLFMTWKTQINAKALSYLIYPREVLASVPSVPYMQIIFVALLQAIIAIYVLQKGIKLKVTSAPLLRHKITITVLLLFLIPVSIRGGIQSLPISRSWVYYSQHAVLNSSATNGLWNFMEVLFHPSLKTNPYKYYTKEEAEQIVAEMQEDTGDSVLFVLKTQRPNIVLILLESVSAECLYCLHGIKDIMPGLDSIAKEGLLFTNFYANGFRTEQGLASVLCGFPAQPKTTIMREYGKFEHLPNLPKMLGKNGYSKNYYYSGNTRFANTESFLETSGFSKILNEDNYQWNKKTYWGAYDEELFACHLKEAEHDPAPFFSIIMTSTNHDPFEADVEEVFKGKSKIDRYKNTVHYTDQCVWDYLQKAKEKPWYANTLFVIMSDHAHNYPKDRGSSDYIRHHIPLIFYGAVLKENYRGKQIETVGSQIDFPATLLTQMALPNSAFSRSENILTNNRHGFAYYTFDNGFGIITPDQVLVYDHNLQQVTYRKEDVNPQKDEQLLRQGKAYLQHLMDEFIGFNNPIGDMEQK